MNPVRVGGWPADHQAERLGHPFELSVDILPFAHPEVVQIFGAAEAAKLVAAELFLLLAKVFPQVEHGQKIARWVGESGVRLVSLRSALQGTFARVLDAQPRHDCHHLGGNRVQLRLHDHPGEPWVDGKLAKF